MDRRGCTGASGKMPGVKELTEQLALMQRSNRPSFPTQSGPISYPFPPRRVYMS